MKGFNEEGKTWRGHAFKSLKEDLPLASFTTLMYAIVPNIGDGDPMNHNDFVETYGLIC